MIAWNVCMFVSFEQLKRLVVRIPRLNTGGPDKRSAEYPLSTAYK